MAGSLVFVAAILIHLATDYGELVISSDFPDVEIVVKQGDRTVDSLELKQEGSRTTKIRSGNYEIELRNAGSELRLDRNRITLIRGGQEVVSIIRKNKQPPGEEGSKTFGTLCACPTLWATTASPRKKGVA